MLRTKCCPKENKHHSLLHFPRHPHPHPPALPLTSGGPNASGMGLSKSFDL